MTWWRAPGVARFAAAPGNPFYPPEHRENCPAPGKSSKAKKKRGKWKKSGFIPGRS
nr:hypothetical protein [Candidatus Sigynarchaeota archaeon]